MGACSGKLNVLALAREGESWVFLFDDASACALTHTLGRFAANPDLNFSWYDAAVLSRELRAMFREKETNRD